MEELIKTFHIDWKLMIAQLVNFAIVAAVLWRFALKPLLKTLQDRSATIDKSLKHAAAIEQRLRDTEDETTRQITSARAQALAILNESKKQAEEKRKEMLEHARTEVEQIVASAKEQIRREKDEMLRSARRDLGSLVIAGMERVLSKQIADTVDHAYIKDQVDKLQ